MLAPVVENRTVRGSARARRRSELANRRRRCHGQPPSGWHLRRRFANFQRQRRPADPRDCVFCADGPRISVGGSERAGARDDESNSEIADGGATGNCLPRGTFVGGLPASSVSASLLTPHKLYDYVSRRPPPVNTTQPSFLAERPTSPAAVGSAHKTATKL